MTVHMAVSTSIIVVVLDPRYKINYLRVKYTIYYSENNVKEFVDRVTNSLQVLMEEYKYLNEEEGVGKVANHSPQWWLFFKIGEWEANGYKRGVR